MDNNFEKDLKDILNPSDSSSENQFKKVKELKEDSSQKITRRKSFKAYPAWFEMMIRILSGILVVFLLLLFGLMISRL